MIIYCRLWGNMFDYGLFSKDHPVWLGINNMKKIEGADGPCQSESTHARILNEIAERQKSGETSIVFDMKKKQPAQRRNTTKVSCVKNNILFKFNSIKEAAAHIGVNPNTIVMAIKRCSFVNGWTIQKDV